MKNMTIYISFKSINCYSLGCKIGQLDIYVDLGFGTNLLDS